VLSVCHFPCSPLSFGLGTHACLVVVCLLAVDLESPLPLLSPALQWCALWLWIWNFLDLPYVFCLLRNGFIPAMELESPCAFAFSAVMCVLVGDLESRHHVILLILQWYAVWLWIWNFLPCLVLFAHYVVTDFSQWFWNFPVLLLALW